MLIRRHRNTAGTPGIPTTEAPEAEAVEAPGGNASRDEWETYALAQGKTADELDGLTRNEIRDLFA